MSSSSKRRQDEKHLKILRELAAHPSNRICFDCHQKGPTYINMTIGSYVCTTCSGHLRGLNPPHRVKSISMASFTIEEIEQIKSRGNEICKAVWLGLFDDKSKFDLESKDEHMIKQFMIAKYEKKRFYLEGNGVSKAMLTQQSPVVSTTIKTEPNKSAFKIPAPSSAISRTAAGLSALSKSNGLSKPVTKSSSVDLLSGIISASEHLEKNSIGNSFALPPPSSSPSVPSLSTIQNENFANFDNANIFSSTPAVENFADLSEGFPSLELPQLAANPKPSSVSSSDSNEWDDFSGGMPLIPTGSHPIQLPSLNLCPDPAGGDVLFESASKHNSSNAMPLPNPKSMPGFARSASLPSSLGEAEKIPFFGILKASTKSLLRSASKERLPRKQRSYSLSCSDKNFVSVNQYRGDYNDQSERALKAQQCKPTKVQSMSDLSKLILAQPPRQLDDKLHASTDSLENFESERASRDQILATNRQLSAISTKLRARLLSEDGWQASQPSSDCGEDAKNAEPVIVYPKHDSSAQASDFSNLCVFSGELASPSIVTFETNPVTNVCEPALGMAAGVSNQLTNAPGFLTEMPAVKSSPIPFSFSSNPLSPFTSSVSSPSSPPNQPAPSTSADRYAALKDLDDAFKFRKEKEPVAPDSNFNHQPHSLHQPPPTNVFGGNSNWANFEAQKPPSNPISQDPWSNNSSNPFASPQQPTTVASYNPFL